MFYEVKGGTIEDQISDLALLLTAGRLSADNHIAIQQACSSEPDSASVIRCIQQLIVSTGEFHSTNNVTQSDVGRAAESSNEGTSTEPYKAIVYLYLGGGCDSFNLLTPHTCLPVDVYDKYRIIRGKSDISEGIGVRQEPSCFFVEFI